MATKTPSHLTSDEAPVTRFLSRAPVTTSCPRMSSTTEFHANEIFSLFIARSCMIFEARSLSRR